MTEQSPLNVASAEMLGTKQRLFIRYFTAVLIDLVVLNLYAEHWHLVALSSFTVSLAVAVLLQILLTLTLKIEHRVAEFFNAKKGPTARFLRFFSAWLILFVSKLVILGLIDFAFGDSIQFLGHLHGVISYVLFLALMRLCHRSVTKKVAQVT